MPELPEMQALAERLDHALAGHRFEGFDQLGLTGLKTASPAPDELVGRRVLSVGRRAKYDVIVVEGGDRVLFHLMQGGRLDLESPAKATKPRGSIVRMRFDGDTSILLYEYGPRRQAGWWILGPGDDGPLAGLGPEPDGEAFAELILKGDGGRRLNTWLRDQHVVAGIGRGYADDALNRAKLSPFATLRGLDEDERQRLLGSIRQVLAEATDRERERTGGLSGAKLGDRFLVHRRAGEPCPNCGTTLERISYESSEIVYCPTCQTGGRTLADRRMSRLLR